MTQAPLYLGQPRSHWMPADKRELYSSPNGDNWFLARDPATGNLIIRHEANIPSGGRMTEIDIGTFLGGGAKPRASSALALAWNAARHQSSRRS
jgi:hypothetical protein